MCVCESMDLLLKLWEMLINSFTSEHIFYKKLPRTVTDSNANKMYKYNELPYNMLNLFYFF